MYVMIGTFVAFLILPILMDRTNLYYGFLPGKPYRFIKSKKELSLDGRSFHFQFIDAREGVTTASCYDQPLDRKTELEGARGIDFLKDYLLQSVTDAGGKIDDTNGENISVELNAISFAMAMAMAMAMARFANLRVHGIVEFKVKTSSGEKSYCSHMTD